jgi:Rrf2 family protein
MKLTAKCYYGLVACVDLTKGYGDGPIRAANIANKHGIPVRFLELILNELKSVGVVDSKRGADGGFYLLKRPEELSVLDVVSAIDGEINIFDCGKIKDGGECLFKGYMGGLKAVIEDYLKNTNLKELSDSCGLSTGVLNYSI